MKLINDGDNLLNHIWFTRGVGTAIERVSYSLINNKKYLEEFIRTRIKNLGESKYNGIPLENRDGDEYFLLKVTEDEFYVLESFTDNKGTEVSNAVWVSRYV